MAKVILNKREAEIWRTGKANVPADRPEYGVLPGTVPETNSHDEWRQLVADGLHTLAGHLGGCGIDFVDEDGNDLSDPNDTYGDMTFQYGDPLDHYTGSIETISINDLDSN